jgi:hypothetical protein
VTTFVVPPADEQPWPTLGPGICDLIEERAIFGPGSLKGKPAKLDAETRALFYKSYELYPRGHELAGRRRFRRVRVSLRKGTAKTEKLGWVAFAELHPEAPVRFDGWDAYGNPVGRPVNDPYIPLLAYTAEQVEELAYQVLYVICTEGPDADLFDSGLDRIIRLGARGQADGKAVPLANSPGARDGARTTFQGYDETHRLELARQIDAYNTMEANLPKRPLDDPWSMGITTAGVPGRGSVAEIDKDEAEAIARGEIEEPELFYFHREAAAIYDMKTLQGRMDAIREASGPAAEWSDLRGIAKQWDKPKSDHRYLERVWTNRWTQAEAQAFDARRWRDDLSRPGVTIPDGAMVTGGLDGSRWKDTTGFVLTDVATGLQINAGLWEPELLQSGEVPVGEVIEAVADAFRRFNVLRIYGDPARGWDDPLAQLAGRFGPKKVVFWYTDSRNLRKTAMMCRAYSSAIKAGEVTNDGDEKFLAHVGAAQKRDIHQLDEDGVPLWVMEKERHDSPNKIDLAMSGGLSWQARLDSIAAGIAVPEPVVDSTVLVFR